MLDLDPIKARLAAVDDIMLVDRVVMRAAQARELWAVLDA
jgi:hypothetical protein